MSQQYHIELDGRPLDIQLSNSAAAALAKRTTPLNVEMELYFSCLIRKQVRFREAADNPNTVSVSDKLKVYFRPVMTQACGKNYEGDEPPLTDFPIANARAYIPHWLRLDYQNDQWQGEFGYSQKH